MIRSTPRFACLVLLILQFSSASCLVSRGQRYSSFTTPTPIPSTEFLIIGFMGGREPWDNEKRGVRRLALKLRDLKLPASIETVENKKRSLAIQLIVQSLDRNGDSRLDKSERAAARLMIYGQSFGGAAVVKLARQLHKMEIPILLTVQVDSVGRDDAKIPPNVRLAANLFQSNGIFIKGEPKIWAEDPSRTTIIGNFQFDYANKEIDLSGVNWFKKLFRSAHTKMDYDPDVWLKVENLILRTVKDPPGHPPVHPHLSEGR